MLFNLKRWSAKSSRFSLIGALLVVHLIAGCASTVQQGGTQAGQPSGTTSSTGAASPAQSAPSMSIPPASAKRIVLNMQLAPQHPKDAGWNDFKKEWHDIGKEQVSAKQIAFLAQEGEPKPSGEEGTLVVVNVSDYKVVSQAARIMLGILSGNAYINAKVQFRDLKTGELRGERTYDTTSSAWQGIFAPVTYKQIYALVDQIIAEVGRP